MSDEFHEEEQAMEKEALEAILMDDLEILSDTSPRQYRVKIVPYPNGEGENHVGIKATFSIPPTYPDVAAEISISVEKGLSESQHGALQKYAAEKAEENIGMSMVYTLVDIIREWLIENNIKGQDGSMHAEMLKRMHMKEKEKKKESEAQAAKLRAARDASGETEEDELMRQKKLEGTAVTVDSFVAWRELFEAEMAALNGVQKVVVSDKPSGKEMFMKNLAGTAEEDEDGAQFDEDEAAAAGGGKGFVEVNTGLFNDDDDDSDSDFELDDDDEDEDDDDSDDDEELSEEESGRGKGAKAGGGGKKR